MGGDFMQRNFRHGAMKANRGKTASGNPPLYAVCE
jgi:hypothetical protein